MSELKRQELAEFIRLHNLLSTVGYNRLINGDPTPLTLDSIARILEAWDRLPSNAASAQAADRVDAVLRQAKDALDHVLTERYGVIDFDHVNAAVWAIDALQAKQSEVAADQLDGEVR